MKHHITNLLKWLLNRMQPPETVTYRMGTGTMDVLVCDGDGAITEDNREVAFYQL